MANMSPAVAAALIAATAFRDPDARCVFRLLAERPTRSVIVFVLVFVFVFVFVLVFVFMLVVFVLVFVLVLVFVFVLVFVILVAR